LLRSLGGLAKLSDLGGGVHIHDSPTLELVDLGSLSNLPGSLTIAHNGSAAPKLVLDLHQLALVHLSGGPARGAGLGRGVDDR